MADAAGDLFGTTTGGGAAGGGTAFEIKKTAAGYAGTPTILVSFNNASEITPTSALVADLPGTCSARQLTAARCSRSPQRRRTFSMTTIRPTSFGGTRTATSNSGIRMVRAGFAGQDLGVVSTSWQIAGTGDFNGAGEAGILWRNTNGDTELWNSNGSGGFVGRIWASSPQAGRSPGPATSTGRVKPASYGATPTATRSCGIPTARAGSPARIWASSPPAGRSPGPAISPGQAKPAFCGATPMAIPSCGIPTARAASPARIWASSPPAGRSPGPATSPGRQSQHSVAQRQRRYRVVESQRLGRVHRPGSGRRLHQLADCRDRRLQRDGQSGILWRNTNGRHGAVESNGSGGFVGQDLGVVATSWSVHKIFA